jgi:hypothetical protein
MTFSGKFPTSHYIHDGACSHWLQYGTVRCRVRTRHREKQVKFRQFMHNRQGHGWRHLQTRRDVCQSVTESFARAYRGSLPLSQDMKPGEEDSSVANDSCWRCALLAASALGCLVDDDGWLRWDWTGTCSECERDCVARLSMAAARGRRRGRS